MTGDAADGRPGDPRLRALCDLRLPAARDRAGWHGYDGEVADLSPDGVRSLLARLGSGDRRADPFDEAHLAAAERAEQVRFGAVAYHRWNPQPHIANLDLGVYDRPYAPVEERRSARRRHLAAWPDAVDAACESLDAVPALVAEALLPTARGLAATIGPEEAPEAIAAHRRLVEHLERAATTSEADPALGSSALAALLGAPEAVEVDLDALVERAADERRRLGGILEDACGRLRPGLAVVEAVATLIDDHPADADGMVAEARDLTAEAIAFVRERDLLDDLDGECRVVPSPPTRRWATASVAWAAPYEPDGPSWFYITPPDPSWERPQQRNWLRAFSRTTLPATAVHEAAPGHFAHGRMLRRAPSDVRRTLQSPAFVEGWAHYGEELCVEEGFHGDDPRFSAGVALKALLRVVRLEVAVGIHTGALSEEDAASRFAEGAHVRGPVARAEARRAAFDPTYGRYTWGKLAVLDARERARQRWGAGFTLKRFHQALLDLGSPPLGLLSAVVGEKPGGSHDWCS